MIKLDLNPTSLISCVNKLLVLHFKGENYFGIYNLSPNGSCSWYEIGNFILGHVKDKKFKLKTINKFHLRNLSLWQKDQNTHT